MLYCMYDSVYRMSFLKCCLTETTKHLMDTAQHHTARLRCGAACWGKPPRGHPQAVVLYTAEIQITFRSAVEIHNDDTPAEC